MLTTRFFPCLLVALVTAAGYSASAATPDRSASRWQLAQVAAADVARRDGDDADALKIAAVEALMAAPPERALPLIEKVLAGDNSDKLKSRALFVLSQIRLPRAQVLLLDLARSESDPLRHDAIRMIGIGGTSETVGQLGDIYRSGDEAVRHSVLNAYLIAGEPGPVYDIARQAGSDDEFAAAVQVLGAMRATDELRKLLDSGGNAKGLIHAYAIAGDLDSLRQLAARSDDPEQRAQAIRSIGIVGGTPAKALLMELYEEAGDETTKDAARQGLLISDHDEGVVTLYRKTADPAEKRKLLRLLTNMNSELALQIIDSALEDE